MEEIIEQAAEKHKSTITDYIGMNEDCKQSFIAGAKWMSREMYTAEEVKEILIRFKSDTITQHYAQVININPYNWFKDFIKNEENQGRLLGFTEDQMFLFAEYMMGKKIVNPEKDAREIMDEWKSDFNYKSL